MVCKTKSRQQESQQEPHEERMNREEAGEVIFAPDAPEYEKKEHHYLSHFEPRRQLLRTWCFMGSERRENRARVTLRRYMALVANVELREKVFGF